MGGEEEEVTGRVASAVVCTKGVIQHVLAPCAHIGSKGLRSSPSTCKGEGEAVNSDGRCRTMGGQEEEVTGRVASAVVCTWRVYTPVAAAGAHIGSKGVRSSPRTGKGEREAGNSAGR